jgi:iron complex outermembrane receptor protein
MGSQAQAVFRKVLFILRGIGVVKRKNSFTRITGALALLALASETTAQGQLEEIVVTARKQEESLMTAPLAISAFSAETLEKMNLTEMTEIAEYTPGFHFQNQIGGGSGRNDRSTSSLTFRGLYLGTGARGADAGALVFIDGAAVIGGQAPPFLDFQRVEVLKGPQAAYFGRSVMTGAINYVTRQPNTEEFGGRVTASFAEYDSSLLQFSVEGPVTDTLALRFSASRDEKGGHYKNAANPSQTLGDRKTDSAALQALFQPNDKLTVTGYLQYMEHDDGPPAQASLKASTGDLTCDLGGRGPYFCGELPSVSDLPDSYISGFYENTDAYFRGINDPLQNRLIPASFNQDPGALKREALNSHIRFDYVTDSGYTFSSLTAYHSDESVSNIDLNFRQETGTGIWALFVQSKFEDFSQEFRITSPQDQRLRWTAGFNYLYTETPTGGVGGTFPFGTLRSSGIIANETKTPSVFGGIAYDITDQLTLSVDARFQRDEIFRQQLEGRDIGVPPPPELAAEVSAEFNSFSPRISLDYQYADNSTVYALYSKGFRPGGFNNVLNFRPPEVVAQFEEFGAGKTYEEEELDNYEIGFKSDWLDGRLRTRLAAYYGLYSKGQSQITVTFQNEFGELDLASVFVNTGETTLMGVEFEFDAAPTDNWTVSGSFGLADSEVDNFFCIDGNLVYGEPNCDGNTLPQSSRLTWSLSSEYGDNLFGNYDWFVRADYSHQGKQYTDYSNEAWIAPKDIVNARAGVRSESLSVEAFVTNLFDQDDGPSATFGNELFTFASSNEIRYGLAQKRQAGMRAVWNF